MVTISEGAFAKVNLTLDVLGKREDGYHDIKSIMQTISLHDDVTVDIGTGAPWQVHCYRSFPRKGLKSSSASVFRCRLVLPAEVRTLRRCCAF